MVKSDLRRLHMVLPYLYPNLDRTKDWKLFNKRTGITTSEGTQFKWLNKDVPPPTDKELLDGKEGGMTQFWWKVLRNVRNRLLGNFVLCQ